MVPLSSDELRTAPWKTYTSRLSRRTRQSDVRILNHDVAGAHDGRWIQSYTAHNGLKLGMHDAFTMRRDLVYHDAEKTRMYDGWYVVVAPARRFCSYIKSSAPWHARASLPLLRTSRMHS